MANDSEISYAYTIDPLRKSPEIYDTMSRIQQLDSLVINKIAAGEVIERPASIVKELLENSIDAAATRIEIEVEQGGLERICITDNGMGIHPDDLQLAVTSHATSKIAKADDLFEVQTLGFRGEALASISAVSHFRIRSRTAEYQVAAELKMHASAAQLQQQCAGPVGTTIEITDLFLNTPVRRKFLKRAATEFSYISEQFTRIALAHPQLHFVLKHNGRNVFELPRCENLIERLSLFYGRELTDQLIWVESQADPVQLWGYVAHPSQNKASRKSQYFFLNGRWITDRSLGHAMAEAYRGLLMTGRHAIAFLFWEMPSELVDVNVHPTKAEVRFRDSQQLYRQLLSTLRTQFLSTDLPNQLNMTRSMAESKSVDPTRQLELQHDLANWAKQGLGNQVQHALAPLGSLATDNPMIGPTQSPAALTEQQHTDPGVAIHDEGERLADRETENEPAVANPEVLATVADQYRAMQIHDSYIVLETEEGLSVIDQHALHERVLYEQFRERILHGAVESQKMLVSLSIELSPVEAGLLLDQKDVLAQLGLQLEEFGTNTILLSSYPVMLARADLKKLVHDLADQLQDLKQLDRRELLDSLMHTMACKAAVKAGDRLTKEEVDHLLVYRHVVDDAHHCPHGRPTSLLLSRETLDRQFGRLG